MNFWNIPRSCRQQNFLLEEIPAGIRPAMLRLARRYTQATQKLTPNSGQPAIFHTSFFTLQLTVPNYSQRP
jgi:hypothetical protein